MNDRPGAANKQSVNIPYREYCETFEYFGRGGHPRLDRTEFDVCHAEFQRLDALRPHLTAEQTQRLIDLRDLLLRDRPLTRILESELRGKTPRRLRYQLNP